MIPATILLIIVWAARQARADVRVVRHRRERRFQIAVMIIPYLVAMLFVIKVFMASGIFEDMKYGIDAGDAIGRAWRTTPIRSTCLPLALTQATHRQRVAGRAARILSISTGQIAFSASPRRS